MGSDSDISVPLLPPIIAAADTASGDWRSDLEFGERERIVNKILDTLKWLLPISVPEGLIELKKIAVRFEERIYTAATSQSDYLRMISLKMLSMETKTHGTSAINPSLSSEPLVGIGSSSKSAASMDSTTQTGHQFTLDWQEGLNHQKQGAMGMSQLHGFGSPQNTISAPEQSSNVLLQQQLQLIQMQQLSQLQLKQQMSQLSTMQRLQHQQQQVSQGTVHQINDLMQGSGMEPGIYQPYQLMHGASLPVSSPKNMQPATSQISHSSLLVGQQNLLSSHPEPGMPLQYLNSPYVAPFTPFAPSSVPVDTEVLPKANTEPQPLANQSDNVAALQNRVAILQTRVFFLVYFLVLLCFSALFILSSKSHI